MVKKREMELEGKELSEDFKKCRLENAVTEVMNDLVECKSFVFVGVTEKGVITRCAINGGFDKVVVSLSLLDVLNRFK